LNYQTQSQSTGTTPPGCLGAEATSGIFAIAFRSAHPARRFAPPDFGYV